MSQESCMFCTFLRTYVRPCQPPVPTAPFRLTWSAARGQLSARPWSFSHPCPPEPVPSARTAAGPSRPAESGRVSRHGSRSSVSFPTFDCVNRRARRLPDAEEVSRGESVSESTVLKFGGTSVADAGALQRVAGVVQRAHRSTCPIVVVSALAGVTDALLAAADAAASGDAERNRLQLDALLERHAEIAGRLARPENARGIRTVLGRARGEIAVLLERVAGEPARRPALRDEIASYGERLAAALLTAALLAADAPARYLDARHCLITDEAYGRATPMPSDTEQRTRAEPAPLPACR